jgi:Xaa-Pro aminopeptidase
MGDNLLQVRSLMKARGWDVYLLPRTDEHQSEYIANTDERVQFISGFSGSNAIALITAKEALLWTDGRYFLQAEKELLPGWELRKLLQGEKMWFEHVIADYPGASLGVDPRLLTACTPRSTQSQASSDWTS